MSRWNILVVDDEDMICSLVEGILRTESYTVDCACDVASGWQKLNAPDSSYNLVILDRIMPDADGLQLLNMIKSSDRLKHLPVIIQSGATSPEQIAEGIEAGAYYYLTKPYDSKALLGIVNGAIKDIEFRSEVATEAARHTNSLNYITRLELSYSTLEDVNNISGFLASLCPDPDNASQGLMELLLNAVEHGNLGIDYNEKKQLMYEKRWENELHNRLMLPEYKDRKAIVIFERKKELLQFRITDQGNGFDWMKYLKLDPARSHDPNGRGIAMALRFSFSKIEYEGVGNTVVATITV